MPGLLWSGFIFWACLLPGDALPKEDFLNKIYADKLVHTAMYTVLILLLDRAVRQHLINHKRQLGIIAFVAMLQGLCIELLQGSALILHRSFEIADLCANATGILLGIFIRIRKYKAD